jgi:hypothetical protein
MSFKEYLIEASTSTFTKNDLTTLPEEMVKEIKKIIRKGAEDLDQKWANALELVHHGYEQTGTIRPSPDMKGAWNQYEDIISYSVDQLAKNRGLTGDWRMSSSIFNESAHHPLIYYIRYINGKRISETHMLEAKDILEVADLAKKAVKKKGVEIKVKRLNNDTYHITFWHHDVKMREYVEAKLAL